MPTSELIYRVAEMKDHDLVLKFLQDFFFPEECINIAHPIKDDTMEELFAMSLLPEGNMVMALDKHSDEFAGLLMFGPITKEYSNESREEGEETSNRKWREILYFMSNLEAKADICRRYQVGVALHLHGVAVSKNFRGQGIGEKLFEECFRQAKLKNIGIVSADCTSPYSVRIAEKLGMELASTFSYDEYHKSLGKTIFTNAKPQGIVKTFIKKIL